MSERLTQILSPGAIQALAGEPSYSRGVEYHREGRVVDLRTDAGSVRATVSGSQAYRVELELVDGELEYSCTCPYYGDHQLFCKHCVAVALAARQDIGEGGPADRLNGGEFGPGIDLGKVRKHLLSLAKETLVDLILRHGTENDRLRGQLILMTGTSDGEPDLYSWKKVIDEAVDPDGFIDHKSMYEYSQVIRDVLDELCKLLDAGHASSVIDLVEHFLVKFEIQTEYMGDSDGFAGGILEELQEMHHGACMRAKPDPEQLAQRLFQWGLGSYCGVFSGAVDRYADVFGAQGLKRYQAIAEAKWAGVPPLGPGLPQERFSGERSRITSIMERLAERTGDLDQLVAVKSRDLSSEYQYLDIAEACQKAGMNALAIEWAEKGVRAFPQGADARLRGFLAEEYRRAKRHSDAVNIIWAEYSEHPHLNEFKVLKSYALRDGGVKAWKRWREKALSTFRERLEEAVRDAPKSAWTTYRPDFSDLVAIYLWERKIAAAWKAALEGGCNESLWLDLAEKRAAVHPGDALEVYHRLVEAALKRKNNQSYEEAIELVVKIRGLLLRLDRRAEWRTYVQELIATHRRLRNFIAMLERVDNEVRK